MPTADATLLPLLLNAVFLLAAIGILWKGADLLVDSASRIAVRFGVSDLVIGLTIVAFGTSAPEMAVSVSAALKGQSDISVGNIVGSNIFNLGFILGTVALIRAITTSQRLVYRDGVFMIAVTFLLLFLFRDLTLSRAEGVLMLVLLGAYVLALLLKKEPLEEDITQEKATWRDGLLLPLSLLAVVFGGHLLVESASALARVAGISEWVIGVTIIAGGTSAPEMAASIAAALKGKHGMSAGNLLGSDIFNILGILGVAAVLRPLAINPAALDSLYMLSGMVILVVVFLRTGWVLSRAEGAILLLIGLARWVADFS